MRRVLAGVLTLSLGLAWPLALEPAQAQPVGAPKSFADLIDQVDAAVVNIDTVARSQRDPYFEQFYGDVMPPGGPEEKGVGSGFVVDANGLIVTNYHVVRGANTITVTTQTGREFQGRVVGADPSTDLAVIKVNAKGLKALKFAPPDSVRVGDWVVAIGSPLGLSNTVSAGIISALERDLGITERAVVMQTDAAINPGNSGGPLINMKGEVVGVNIAIAARGQNIGFAIPSWIAENVVRQLATTGKVVRPYMGVSIRSLASEEGQGVQIMGVGRASPAAKAGLRPGDMITAVEGKAVKTARDLINMLNTKQVGQAVRLTVRREGKTLTVPVTLEAMPERSLRQP
ncbi:MAG: S1C family serine protease [Candidatus Sericytochromatia bacterium]